MGIAVSEGKVKPRQKETYYYNYVGNEIWGIRIIMTSPATGSRNLGRISLGNLKMIHTI